MRLYVTVPLALLLATACETTDEVSADDALVQTAIAGEEESLSRDNFAMDEEAPQPLLRECDAQRDYDKLFADADQDASGELEDPEQEGVQTNHPPPFAPGPWQLITFVYDTDRSGTLEEAERAVLLDDFTARCEALHDKLLSEFDADASGDLDDSELATAKQALDERRPPPPEDGERPDGPPEGTDSDRPGPPPEGELPPPLRGFDEDGDGELSEAEFAALQADVREHIRNGDPPPPPPGAPEPR